MYKINFTQTYQLIHILAVFNKHAFSHPQFTLGRLNLPISSTITF